MRRAALACLARRDYSQQELITKLKQKNYPHEEVQIIVEELAKDAYLNDQQYVINYVHMRRQKRYGPTRIKKELEQRGISAEIITEHLRLSDPVWQDDVQSLWKKHFKSKKPDNYQEKSKQIRYLHYRGFTTEQIESIFKYDDDVTM